VVRFYERWADFKAEDFWREGLVGDGRWLMERGDLRLRMHLFVDWTKAMNGN
jgi:hypothetical protein